jgi:GTP-binding protein
MEITSATYVISSPGYKDCPPPEDPEYAFIGRSNVGKSSLINMLTNKKNLAKTSATPGKTQLINHFAIKSDDRHKWSLVDLPGYGFATVSQSARRNWSNMIESYIRKRENLVCLFVLIDSRHTPQQIDLDFIDQLGEWQVPFVLAFTKADKNKPGATKRNVAAFIEAMSDRWEQAPPYFVSSANTREGRAEMLDYIGGLNRNLKKL